MTSNLKTGKINNVDHIQSNLDSEVHKDLLPENILVVYNEDIRTSTIKTPWNVIVPYIKDMQEFEEEESNLIPGENIANATNRIYKIDYVYYSCSG